MTVCPCLSPCLFACVFPSLLACLFKEGIRATGLIPIALRGRLNREPHFFLYLSFWGDSEPHVRKGGRAASLPSAVSCLSVCGRISVPSDSHCLPVEDVLLHAYLAFLNLCVDIALRCLLLFTDLAHVHGP